MGEIGLSIQGWETNRIYHFSFLARQKLASVIKRERESK